MNGFLLKAFGRVARPLRLPGEGVAQIGERQSVGGLLVIRRSGVKAGANDIAGARRVFGAVTREVQQADGELMQHGDDGGILGQQERPSGRVGVGEAGVLATGKADHTGDGELLCSEIGWTTGGGPGRDVGRLGVWVRQQPRELGRRVKWVFPVTTSYEGTRIFVRRAGHVWITPLLVVMLVMESTDLVFAIDSIPAVLAVTPDPFIVYTSNVFAMLGLRSLYFLLSGSVRRFDYLQYALAAIFALVGVKMLLADVYRIPILVSLGLVVVFLAVSIGASLLWPRSARPRGQLSQ